MGNSEAIQQLTKAWDPINEKCIDQKNDMKRNLIYKPDTPDATIPKTWILHPKYCESESPSNSVDLADAEKDWVLAQLSVCSVKLKGVVASFANVLDLQQGIDQKWSAIADGTIPTSQAKPSQFTPLTNHGFIERANDYKAKSVKDSDKTVDSGPLGVYWADDNESNQLVVAFRGTATTPQLQKEMESIATQYLGFGPSFVDVKINDVIVGHEFDFFLSNFADLWKDMDDFKKRAQDACKNNKKVKVIGHSLGGALAKTAAMYLAVEQGLDGDCIKLVTFGEPRSSDSTYSVNLKTLLPNPNVARFVYDRDLVPHLPPYKDVGVLGMKLYNPQGKKSAFHNSVEIFLQKDFSDKNSPNFSKYHSCGYDDMKNADGEDCSNSVQNLGNLTDIVHIIETIQNDKEAAQEHINYWPQYNSFQFCFDNPTTTTTATTAPNLII